MNEMPDPTCPECGDERGFLLPKKEGGENVLFWYCPRCGQEEQRRRDEELRKLAEWNKWARQR